MVTVEQLLYSSLVISNSAPVFDVGAISLRIRDITTGSTLTCSASALDPNQGAVNLTYQWLVNGSVIGSNASILIDANQTDVGNSMECVVTATDSDGESTTSNTAEVIINTLPSITSVSILAQTGMYNDSVVECIPIIVDPDESLTPSTFVKLPAVSLGQIVPWIWQPLQCHKIR